jgi:sugar lactone lactonase YvrE
MLLVELPEYCPTPDGMAVAPNGDLVVACPNFATFDAATGTMSTPACLIRIDPDLHVRKWFDVPILLETGRACPMGICFDESGTLYVVDNQNWPTGNGPDGSLNQGRVLRIGVDDAGHLEEFVVVADGISHPNGVRYRDGALYVTVSLLPRIPSRSGRLVSGVYRFPAGAEGIRVSNTREDEHLLCTFVTENEYCQYGADGLVFGRDGTLYVGDFGDGEIYAVELDSSANVASCKTFARTDHEYWRNPASEDFLEAATSAVMRTTDGMCMDDQGLIYVADFSNNAVAMVLPTGEIRLLSQNGDCDGSDGRLDQPGEPILWRGRLVVTNFDVVTGPDKVNTSHDKPYTISSISLGSSR